MTLHQLEIEKQYVLSDDFLFNIIDIPKKEFLQSFNPEILPTHNPYFSRFIHQDIISYAKDETGIKSITRVRHERHRNGEEKLLLCFKHGSLLDLVEKETEITKKEFNSLIKNKQTDLLHLDKLRYLFPIASTGYILEIDIFTHTLAGIHVAEIEFETVEQMNQFINPPFIIKDITYSGLFSQETISYFSQKSNLDYSKFIK